MHIKTILYIFLLWGICFSSFAGNRKGEKEYVIVANQSLARSPEWSEVINYLCEQHEAEVVYYLNSPSEVKVCVLVMWLLLSDRNRLEYNMCYGLIA